MNSPASPSPESSQKTSVWRSKSGLRFWIQSLLAAPIALVFAVIISGIAGGSFGVFTRLLFGVDQRLAGTLLGATGEILAKIGVCIAIPITLVSVVAWWISQSPVSFSMNDKQIVRWGITGAQNNRVERRCPCVCDIFTPRNLHKETIHLWTPWREMAISAHHITDQADLAEDRDAQFTTFLETLGEHLQNHGKHLERDIPTTPITNTRSALRYLLFWPHRRLLVRRIQTLQNTTPPAWLDHTKPLPSLALGWLFRPSSIVFGVFTLALILITHHATKHPAATTLATWGGLSILILIPLWNLTKETILKFRGQGDWMPESSIGQHTLKGPLPDRLLPAPSCIIDFKSMSVQRPDNTLFSFKDIQAVEYGPAKHAHAKPSPSQAWHLAVYTKDEPQRPREIFGNASADIVRHGDLDAGYAAFNWIAAREVALRSDAHLILAHGRVAHTHVGTNLQQRLTKDITRYDPAPMRKALEDSGEESRVFTHATPEALRVWGPLTRQPEHCATVPIWKALTALVCIPLLFLGYTPVGAIIGYLVVLCVYDIITYLHFRSPGFRMDTHGVWVRGVCIEWDDLEASSLMPVAPGPILFAGARTVTIAGHIGSSYNERAWLGCVAYQWIRANICASDDMQSLS